MFEVESPPSELELRVSQLESDLMVALARNAMFSAVLQSIVADCRAERYDGTPMTTGEASSDVEKELVGIIDNIADVAGYVLNYGTIRHPLLKFDVVRRDGQDDDLPHPRTHLFYVDKTRLCEPVWDGCGWATPREILDAPRETFDVFLTHMRMGGIVVHLVHEGHAMCMSRVEYERRVTAYKRYRSEP